MIRYVCNFIQYISTKRYKEKIVNKNTLMVIFILRFFIYLNFGFVWSIDSVVEAGRCRREWRGRRRVFRWRPLRDHKPSNHNDDYDQRDATNYNTSDCSRRNPCRSWIWNKIIWIWHIVYNKRWVTCMQGKKKSIIYSINAKRMNIHCTLKE